MDFYYLVDKNLTILINKTIMTFFLKCTPSLQVNASRGQHQLLLAHYKHFNYSKIQT